MTNDLSKVEMLDGVGRRTLEEDLMQLLCSLGNKQWLPDLVPNQKSRTQLLQPCAGLGLGAPNWEVDTMANVG